MSGILGGGIARPGITGSAGAGPTVALAFNGSTSVLTGRVTNPGGAIAGLTVSIYLDGAGTPAKTATTASDGTFSVTFTGLGAGAHTFLAKTSVQVSGSGGGVVVSATISTGASADLSDPNRSLNPLI